jgi:polar amino acid transport system permease protein
LLETDRCGGAQLQGAGREHETEDRGVSGIAQVPGVANGFMVAVRAVVTARFTQILLFLLVLAGIAITIINGASEMGYNWQWYRIPPYIARIRPDGIRWGKLSEGLVQTVIIAGHALVISAAIGAFIAILRLSSSFSGRWLARAYLEIIRNTPLLVQIYIFYFVIARVYPLDRFWAGVMALSCFEAAFISEILRAGIVAIPAGQWEVCSTLGMSRLQTLRHVVLPQALVAMTPPLISAGISLIKDSSIVSVIGLFELTTAGRDAISDSFLSFEVWLTVAAIYLVVTVTLSTALNVVETRLRRRLS